MRKTLEDKVGKEVIRDGIEVRQTAVHRMNENRLVWCGHVRRMEEHN
jgi:hypothetical protein